MRTVFFTSLFLVACSNDSHNGGPNAPSDLMVEALSGGAHVTWKDNSDNETEFMIERKDAGASYAAIGTVPFDTVAYHDGTVEAGKTYTYRVTAMNGTAHSAPSNEVDFTAPMTASVDMATSGSATCHSAGCRTFASYCSTNACTCIALIKDNPDPVCAGTMVTCAVDPCAGKTATCNHGTGQCDLN
jgi:hypothetical protein